MLHLYARGPCYYFLEVRMLQECTGSGMPVYCVVGYCYLVGTPRRVRILALGQCTALGSMHRAWLWRFIESEPHQDRRAHGKNKNRLASALSANRVRSVDAI